MNVLAYQVDWCYKSTMRHYCFFNGTSLCHLSFVIRSACSQRTRTKIVCFFGSNYIGTRTGGRTVCCGRLCYRS
jgi:hypothetical protein